MGGPWFDDSITTIEGKEGRESLRGKWIIELAELNSIKRSEVASVKNFLSNQTDIYRAAYDRRVTPYPRQCVFCGTTNEDKFLKGDTGNRRFWVIQIMPELCDESLAKRLERLEQWRDQLWAEAVHYYKTGEKLYLDEEHSKALRNAQEEFSDEDDDPTKELLRQFLDMKLPGDWDIRNLPERRCYVNAGDPLDAKGTEQRTVFCNYEFLCERMGYELRDKNLKYLARKISKLMREFPNWEPLSSTRHAEKLYGIQRGFRRRAILENSEDDL
jgi:predicted P-loop ATPase